MPMKFVSVCPFPKKRNHPSFVNISPIEVANWYINGKVFTSSYYRMETHKFEFFKKGKNWILSCAEVLKSP